MAWGRQVPEEPVLERRINEKSCIRDRGRTLRIDVEEGSAKESDLDSNEPLKHLFRHSDGDLLRSRSPKSGGGWAPFR